MYDVKMRTIKNRAFCIIYLANLITNTFSRLNGDGNSELANFPAEISRYIISIASKGKIFSVVAEYVKYFFDREIDIRSFNYSKLHVNEMHISEQRFSAVAFVI